MPTTKFTPVSKRSSCVQSYLCQSGFLTNSFLLCLTRQETLLLICKQHAAVRSAHELAIAIQLPLAPATAEIKREATQAGVCLQQPLGSETKAASRSIERSIVCFSPRRNLLFLDIGMRLLDLSFVAFKH